MKTSTLIIWRACALATILAAALPARAQALAAPAAARADVRAETVAPEPLASFFDNPVFTGARLSPNAKALAVRFGGGGARDRLAVIDLANNTIKVVAKFNNGDVGDFDWVNDERLVFNSADKRIGVGAQVYAPGLYAVNRDGGDYRELATQTGDMLREHNATRTVLPWNTFMLGQHGRQDSDFIYVSSPKYLENGDLDYVNLLRLNTLTGRSSTVERPAAGTQSWMLDHQGEPRLAISHDKNIETVWYRDPAGDKWRALTSFDSYKGGKGAFTPLAFGPDGTLYVDTNLGADKHAMHVFDFASNRVKREALIELADYDFQGHLVTDQDKLLGVRYLSDADGTVWFDARLKAIQADVDARLPNTINLVGVAHFKAGWRQWGLKMQDDVADGTRWAIAQGIVDAKRVCIAGASYGGYATLMGLVNDPDLYQCGIDWAGVTDIKLLYTGAWSARSDFSEVYKQYGMPLLVGDPVKDAAQLQATSPIEQAARIKAPLLLAYGGSDLRVPIYHGRRFYDAVKQTNPDVEWVVYGEEGYGWALPQNRIDFWGRVERFLDRHIGH